MAAASTTPPRQHHLLVSHTNCANVGENQPPTDLSIDHRRHLPAPCSVATPSSLRSPFRPSAGLCAFPRTKRDIIYTVSAHFPRENGIHTIRISSPNFFSSVSTRSSSLEIDMWCCKRLDASDWPVTTIVRGNASLLHVANVFLSALGIEYREYNTTHRRLSPIAYLYSIFTLLSFVPSSYF